MALFIFSINITIARVAISSTVDKIVVGVVIINDALVR
jgi:hypothetical protein